MMYFAASTVRLFQMICCFENKTLVLIARNMGRPWAISLWNHLGPISDLDACVLTILRIQHSRSSRRHFKPPKETKLLAVEVRTFELMLTDWPLQRRRIRHPSLRISAARDGISRPEHSQSGGPIFDETEARPEVCCTVSFTLSLPQGTFDISAAGMAC